MFLPALWLTGAIVTLALVQGGATPRLVGEATTTYAVSFAAGMYLSQREGDLRTRLSAAIVRPRAMALLVVACGLFVAGTGVISQIFDDFGTVVAVQLETVLAAGWIIVLVADPNKVLGLASRLMAWLGKRGYGLYVFHWPILQVIVQLPFLAPGGRINALGVLVSFLASVAVSVVSYRWFELRFLAWRRRLHVA